MTGKSIAGGGAPEGRFCECDQLQSVGFDCAADDAFAESADDDGCALPLDAQSVDRSRAPGVVSREFRARRKAPDFGGKTDGACIGKFEMSSHVYGADTPV
ncbi:MAG: hypothetical protein ACLS3C_11025 [Oscillospiraceae bacterium]